MAASGKSTPEQVVVANKIDSTELVDDSTLDDATLQRTSRISSALTVVVAGLALLSDGYNAQIIGYMKPVLQELYKDGMPGAMSTRLSNSHLIGEVFGMLFFGWVIDKIGRRQGIVFATLFLVLSIVLSTAAHGNTQLGMFWMMVVGRGVAGFGAGGEYPVCGTSCTEASDENTFVRRRRDILVAMTTDFVIDLGFVIAGCVALVVLAAYHYHTTEGVWRICFGLDFTLPLVLVFFRIRMIESTQFRKHSIKRKIPYWLVVKRYWKPMPRCEEEGRVDGGLTREQGRCRLPATTGAAVFGMTDAFCLPSSLMTTAARVTTATVTATSWRRA